MKYISYENQTLFLVLNKCITFAQCKLTALTPVWPQNISGLILSVFSSLTYFLFSERKGKGEWTLKWDRHKIKSLFCFLLCGCSRSPALCKTAASLTYKTKLTFSSWCDRCRELSSHSVLSRLMEEGDVQRQRLCGVGEEHWMRSTRECCFSCGWITLESHVFSQGLVFPTYDPGKQKCGACGVWVRSSAASVPILAIQPWVTSLYCVTFLFHKTESSRQLMCASFESSVMSVVGGSALLSLLHSCSPRSLRTLLIFDFCFLGPHRFREGPIFDFILQH